MTSSDASTGWESGDSTATDRPPTVWWSPSLAATGRIGLIIESDREALVPEPRPEGPLPDDAVRLIPIDATEADIVGSRIVSLLRQGNDLHDRVTRERDQLRAQRDAALGLHASAKNYTGCRACYRDWPCPTARALGVTE